MSERCADLVATDQEPKIMPRYSGSPPECDLHARAYGHPLARIRNYRGFAARSLGKAESEMGSSFQVPRLPEHSLHAPFWKRRSHLGEFQGRVMRHGRPFFLRLRNGWTGRTDLRQPRRTRQSSSTGRGLASVCALAIFASPSLGDQRPRT